MSLEALSHDPLEALEKFFGHRKFLEAQDRVVAGLLSGKDALVVMPTGGGKSLCYQLPALVMDGITIVVSPLIALMKDQVDALEAKGIPATMINSTLGPEEQQDRIRQMADGAYKLVYVAPERFRSESFKSSLKKLPIALFAVDEAHCLSQWGHDFRPDYLRLSNAVEELGHPQTAAFTATATPEVRADILQNLRLREPFEIVSGFERPNLSLAVTHCEKKAMKGKRIAAILKQHHTGIVYCSTRKNVDEVSEDIASMGASVIAYHGGMSDDEREHAQNLFINRERDVAVATNAFGMGIDRADVRFVIHHDIPGSVEAYYQEAGRAGRDGEASVCELLFNYADTRTQEFFIEGSNPGFPAIVDIWETLRLAGGRDREVKLTIKEIADKSGIDNTMKVGSALSSLGRAGHIQRFDIPGKRMRGTRILTPDATSKDLQIDRPALEEKERRDRAKLKAMVDFAYSSECRQEVILKYFGEPEPTQCGSCDTCRARRDGDWRAPNDEEKLIAQKLLSGVARMSRKSGDNWVGRFGRAKIAMMLTGSKSKEVLAARLDELSTYGILREYGAPYVNRLIDEMLAARLLVKSDGEYPLVTLTTAGASAMRGKSAYELNWPTLARDRVQKELNQAIADTPGLDATFDDELYNKLRAIRAELAADEGGKPAYVIFSNQTLEFFTRLKPQSLEAGSTIRGVGPKKAEKYLPAFVAAIQAHEKAKAAEDNP